MKNLWILSAALMVAGVFAACDSGSSDTKCTLSSECKVGNVCQTNKCVERPCNGTADCNTPDICVDGATLGKDASKRFCTALQCGEGLPCADGFDCLGGLCIAKTPSDIIDSDVPETDTPREDTVTDTPPVDTGTDTTIPSDRVDCKTCTGDADCGTGAKCLPVGATKHCLSECVDDGDCPPSYICYAASTASKSCLPVSYNCVACSFDTPCEADKVCDFVSGQCKDGKATCDKCTYDFDCATGLRCYKKTGQPSGACVPACSDTVACADATNYTCGTTEKGVQLCQPNGEGCGGCTGTTPFPAPDGKSCYECLNNSHCAAPKTCNITVTPYICEEVGGECGTQKKCPADGKCHQCCADADCAGLPGATGTCTNYACDGVVDECNGQCAAPFPVCAVINNVAQCVQCKATSDCVGIDPSCTCSGDPTYTCLLADGNVCSGPTCGAICSTDADCPPGSSGETLLCSGASGGFCYNPKGTCDGQTSCCPAGSNCFDILSALMGGMGGGLPGMGGGIPGSGMAACTCDDTHACLGGKPCTSTDALCSVPLIGDMFCPGGVKPSTIPDKVCIDIMELLGGILGGI